MFISVLFLTACQDKAATVTHQGYIAAIENNRILVGDIYFSIHDAKLVTDRDKSLALSDLVVGMEVSIEFSGMVAESLPGQASADKVIVMTNEDSKKAEEAVRVIVLFAEKQYGKPILIQSSDLLDDNLFRLEIRVFSEDEPIYIQYDYATKNISLE